MLTSYILSFDSFEAHSDFRDLLDKYHLHYIIHVEDVDDERFYFVVLHKYVFNHFRVQEVLESFNYRVRCYNRSLSALFK